LGKTGEKQEQRKKFNLQVWLLPEFSPDFFDESRYSEVLFGFENVPDIKLVYKAIFSCS
jgi:hypothetical protein